MSTAKDAGPVDSCPSQDDLNDFSDGRLRACEKIEKQAIFGPSNKDLRQQNG
jgi:hypothetical protein